MKKRKVEIQSVFVSDAERLVRVINPAALRNFSFFSRTKLTVEKEREYLRRMLQSSSDKLFLVVVSGTSQIVGTTGLHEIDRYNHTARIGTIIFNPCERHHHYGTEAIELTMDYGFEVLELNKIYGNTFIDNDPVRGLHKKLGFVVEGILRQEYFLRDKYHDMVRESVLRSEWQARKMKEKR